MDSDKPGLNQALPPHHRLLGQPQNRLEAHPLSLLASNGAYVSPYLGNSYRGDLQTPKEQGLQTQMPSGPGKATGKPAVDRRSV